MRDELILKFNLDDPAARSEFWQAAFAYLKKRLRKQAIVAGGRRFVAMNDIYLAVIENDNTDAAIQRGKNLTGGRHRSGPDLEEIDRAAMH